MVFENGVKNKQAARTVYYIKVKMKYNYNDRPREFQQMALAIPIFSEGCGLQQSKWGEFELKFKEWKLSTSMFKFFNLPYYNL